MDKPCYKPEIWGGIECTINRVKKEFYDQLEYSGHYTRKEDLDLIAQVGIKKCRYPVLWERHQPDLNTEIDWTWTAQQLERFRENGIDVIAGLVHHGSGPSFTNLLDPQFPELLASYAKKVITRFPHLNYFTPVNEPLTTARFSGLYGLWYPHYRSSGNFARMLLNQLKGIVLSMEEIRKVNPQAQLIQTEDLAKIYSTPKLKYQARFENERRWLTYDILSGKFSSKSRLWKHFLNLGINKKELQFFQEHPCTPNVFGFNYYITSERFLDERLRRYPHHTYGGNGRHRYADVEAVRVEIEEETGLKTLLKEAWDRYKQPMAITEVHLHSHREEQLRWFKYVWESANELCTEGVQINAVTSWAMLGSYGWDKLLTGPGGTYEPGAFDLRSGRPRPTALANYISCVTNQSNEDHPLSVEKGWWQRSTRILYGPVISEVRRSLSPNSRPLMIVGKHGTLARAFARICESRAIPCISVSSSECDITDPQAVSRIMAQIKPWAVINTAGYVKVDEAEYFTDDCYRVNTIGAQNLAIETAKLNAQLVSFSSDLVFDGKKRLPYLEDDEVNPLNVYGKTKAKAEELIKDAHPDALIIRTSAFFGPWDIYNFVHYIRQQLNNGDGAKVPKDLFISPTYVPDLVHNTLDLLIDREKGIWHLANQGALSWSDLAFQVAEIFDLDKNGLKSVPSSEMGYKADRPVYSVLGSQKGFLLPSLQDALGRYATEQKKERRRVA